VSAREPNDPILRLYAEFADWYPILPSPSDVTIQMLLDLTLLAVVVRVFLLCRQVQRQTVEPCGPFARANQALSDAQTGVATSSPPVAAHSP
jgi:hypothetical protein